MEGVQYHPTFAVIGLAKCVLAKREIFARYPCISMKMDQGNLHIVLASIIAKRFLTTLIEPIRCIAME